MTGRSGIYLTLALTTAVALTVSAVVLAPGSSSAGGNGAASAALNPADFSTNITNPLFPRPQGLRGPGHRPPHWGNDRHAARIDRPQQHAQGRRSPKAGARGGR